MSVSRTVSALAVLGLVMSLTACSNDDTTESSAAYCESSAVVQTEMGELRTMVTGGEATLEEVQEQVSAIGEAAQEAATEADALSDSVRADVLAADSAFDAAIKEIPNDATVSEAATQYQAAVADWDAAIATIRADAGC